MSTSSQSLQLPLDVVGSLRVHGLAKNNAGLPVVIELPLEKPCEPPFENFTHCPPAPALPPPLPPSSGPRIHLDVELVCQIPREPEDDEIEDTDDGFGDSDDDDDKSETEAEELYYDDEMVEDPYQRTDTALYSVRPLNPDQYPYRIPPLVIKVAAQREGRRIYNEANMYNVLESVQGLVVPRCYGYFRVAVNQYETTILPWNPECRFPRDPARFDVFRMPHQSASLNILLLEEVGDRIPIGSVARDDLRTELRTMYEELVRLGIDHHDIRYPNILLAPTSPPGLEGRCSATLKRPFKFRLVDFEHSARTNRGAFSIRHKAERGTDLILGHVCGRSRR
ncbi:hypothetical protein L227DRAFT_599141 [Lentinus tigrinus ALCF2SS1-6]|uniref:Protein kinase domain-containing protein n=1 Tax=Lentinus tigrinus ALCF2SS1-6 TaxID=1328759 RepID=A0A5C2SJN8_9APHY|nr:hypothetical protein L227DRAFT_599141 [Lentinus tigrinus ALCF2SS1-6]